MSTTMRVLFVGLALSLTACSSRVSGGPIGVCTPGSSVVSTTAPVKGAAAGQLSKVAVEMNVGEFRLLETKGYDRTLLDACTSGHTVLEWSNRGYWDALRNEFHFVGQGHQSCEKHLVYTESSDSWTTATAPSFGGIGHGYEHNAMDPATGDMFYRGYNSKRIRKYSASSGVWSDIPAVPTGQIQCCGAIEYFPDMQGLIFVDSWAGVWLYEEQTNSWSQLAGGLLHGGGGDVAKSLGPYHNFATYHPTQKSVVFGGGNGSNAIFAVNARGEIDRLADSPAPLGIGSGILLPNPASCNFMAFYNDGQMYELQMASNTWVSAGKHPIMRHAQNWRVGAVLEPQSVFMFITYNFENSKVLLYKYGIGAADRK